MDNYINSLKELNDEENIFIALLLFAKAMFSEKNAVRNIKKFSINASLIYHNTDKNNNEITLEELKAAFGNNNSSMTSEELDARLKELEEE